MAETQVIRRLNRRLDRSQRPGGRYDGLIRLMLAESVLVNRDSDRVLLPPDLHPWIAERTEQWIEWIQQSGIDVVGDLEDLRSPAPDPGAAWHDPDRVRLEYPLVVQLFKSAFFPPEMLRGLFGA